MKKLKFSLHDFKDGQVLTRSQLRNVLGGGGMNTTMPGGGGSCEAECVTGEDGGCSTGQTCKEVKCDSDQTIYRCVNT